MCTKTRLLRHLDEKEETSWKVTKKVLKIFLGRGGLLMFTDWRKTPRNREMGDLEVGKRGLEKAQIFSKSKHNYYLGQRLRNKDGWATDESQSRCS